MMHIHNAPVPYESGGWGPSTEQEEPVDDTNENTNEKENEVNED